jgi:hypothetical protein
MARLRDMTSDDLYGDETHRALKEQIIPADVFELDTPEGKKVTAYYKRHTYWLSEMYLYLPHFRGPLKKVVQQLKDQDKLAGSSDV